MPIETASLGFLKIGLSRHSSKFDLLSSAISENLLAVVNCKNHPAKIALECNELEVKINYFDSDVFLVSKLVEQAIEDSMDFAISGLKEKEFFHGRNHFVEDGDGIMHTYLHLSNELFLRRTKSKSKMIDGAILARKEEMEFIDAGTIEDAIFDAETVLSWADRTKINVFAESEDSGNVYGISIDRTVNEFGEKIEQVEIEYNNTIGAFNLEEAKRFVSVEMQTLAKLIKRGLFADGVKFSEVPIVKLDWMLTRIDAHKSDLA